MLLRDLEMPKDEPALERPTQNKEGGLPRAEDLNLLALLGSFDELDGNKDSVVDEKELKSAIANPSVKGNAAALAAFIKTDFKELLDVHNDKFDNDREPFSDQPLGVSKGDLRLTALALDFAAKNKLGLLELSQKSIPMFTTNEFKDVDQNQDGKLTLDEIKASASKYPDHAKRIQYFEPHMEAISAFAPEGASKDGVTQEAFINFNMAARHVLNAGCNLYLVDERRRDLAKVSKQPFVNQDNPEASIDIEAIGQGSSGDCIMLASLASIAHSDKKLVRNLVAEEKDGSYTVKLKPGAVNVSPLTESELLLYAEGGKHGVWVPLIEKAVGKYYEENPKERKATTTAEGIVLARPTSDTQEFAKETAFDAFRILAGKDGQPLYWGTEKPQDLFSTKEQTEARHAEERRVIQQKLQKAFEHSPPHMVIAGTSAEVEPKTGLLPNHAYAVLSATKDEVVVFNPNKLGDRKKTIPMTEFLRTFTGIQIADK